MTEPKTISTTEALALCAKILGKPPSRWTLIQWCSKFGIGYQMGSGLYARAYWRVYPDKLEAYIRGKSGIKTKTDEEAIS